MAWTFSESITQNGRHFTYVGRAVTDGTPAEGTLIDDSADLTHMTTNSTIVPLNGRLFSKFKILTMEVTSHASLLGTGTPVTMSWDAGAGTDIEFFVLPKTGSFVGDFRKLPTYGIVNTAGTGVTGDVILAVGATITASDAWNIIIEGYLVP